MGWLCKRYINPNAQTKTYVRLGYLSSVVLVILAVAIGISRAESIHDITKLITFGLYGGYVAPNILKWHWWRFNGYGYFAGMIAGVIAALVPFIVDPDINKVHILPFALGISTIASIVVCLLTPPENDEVLESFYRTVRPWGCWKPVYHKLLAKYPKLKPNTNFRRDAFNVAIGIVWQLTLNVIPICLVIRQFKTMWISIGVLAVTSVIMKFTWYDKLGPGDMYMSEDE